MKYIRIWWHRYSDLAIQWAIMTMFVGVVYVCYQVHLAHERPLFQYLKNHRCEELGRLGQPGELVYRCDNGLHLEGELRKETGTQ